MAEEFDKSEEATPYKLQEARKKGQVARSMEFPALFGLIASLATLFATLTVFGYSLNQHMRWWFYESAFLADNPSQLAVHGFNLTAANLRFLFPILAAGFIAIIVAGIVHIGPVFSTHPLKPDFTKLNPAKGLKKIFSRRSLVELIKLIVKITFFVSVAYLAFQYLKPSILDLNKPSLAAVLAVWLRAAVIVILAFLLVFILSALFDLWYSKREFARQMRMSKRDIKDEHKKREGDPEVKSKRKRNQNELMEKLKSMQSVKDADVIITNPTHVAIALKFRPNSMALPVVLSKGQGLLAQQIIRTARRHRIPILRKVGLARSLLKTVKVGNPIADEHYQSVVRVYQWVISIPGNRVFES